MLQRGTGRIVGISSVIGETGSTGQANYAASKSGLFGLTKSLASRLHGRAAAHLCSHQRAARADRPVVGLAPPVLAPHAERRSSYRRHPQVDLRFDVVADVWGDHAVQAASSTCTQNR
jgi:short chain dehydrogenase